MTSEKRPWWLQVWVGVNAAFLLLAIFIVLFFLLQGNGNTSSRRATCMNNMHQIALALMNYESRYHCFPPAYVADKNGHPTHSWRVLILPFLDRDDLYKKYDFSEPWDGPHNSALMKTCPEVFRCPSADKQDSSATNYVAVVGDTTAWPFGKSVGLDDIQNHDGAAYTLLFVEVAESDIRWMEPRDIAFDQAVVGINVNKRHGISSNHPGMVCVTFADGHLDLLDNGTSPQLLKALLTIAGGEIIEDDPHGGLKVKEPKQ